MREGKKESERDGGVMGVGEGGDSRRQLERLKMLLAVSHSLKVHQFQ